MVLLLVAVVCLLPFYVVNAQNIGIGTASPDASSALDITHSNKGLLIPRMSGTGITAIPNPAKGLLVYDSAANQLMVNMGTAAAPNWQSIVANSGWGLTGNGGTNPAAHFIGTSDNQPFRFRLNNVWAGELHPLTGNVFIGLHSGQANTAGYSNIALGNGALKLNTDRNQITAIGDSALYNNGNAASIFVGDGMYNVAIGSKALYANTDGYENTATGYQALAFNTHGFENAAFGASSLANNTIGIANTSMGSRSLFRNASGFQNTAFGTEALYGNIDGLSNVAIGYEALVQNVSGSSNVVIGSFAAFHNNGNLASKNTVVGTAALQSTTNSQFNTAVGFAAGNFFNNGYNNVFLGANSDVNQGDLFNVIAIGQGTVCTASSQVTIGNGATNSYRAYANWSNISDGRFKKDIQENVRGLSFIMKLRPVTYHLIIHELNNKLYAGRKIETDKFTQQAIQEKEQQLQTGFVAQEVEEAAKQTGYDFSGVDKPKNDKDFYGLRYAEFVVPLVKAVQEQQQMIEALRKENQTQKEARLRMQQQLDELKASIKK